MPIKNKRTIVALLTGGISSEDYLSRRSCRTFYEALNRNRYDFYLLDWQKSGQIIESEFNNPTKMARVHQDILSCFTNFKGHIVLNTLHGEKENGGQIQGLLELAGIPYTGNSLCPSSLGMDKEKTKFYFQHLGIKTPKAIYFSLPLDNFYLFSKLIHDAKLQYPLICKPVTGGSSDGIHLIKDQKELSITYRDLTRRESQRSYFIEEFIDGDDLSVALFNSGVSYPVYTFPIARIRYNGMFFDKQIKFAEKYHIDFPSELKPGIPEKMRKAALVIHRGMGLTSFSRTDFILGDRGLYALEINTHPGMSESSILTHMLNEGEHSLSFFLDQMVKFALGQQSVACTPH